MTYLNQHSVSRMFHQASSANRLSKRSILRWLIVAALLVTAYESAAAPAQWQLRADYLTSLNTRAGNQGVNRLALLPQLKWRPARRWSTELSVRAEWAEEPEELGSSKNFADASTLLIDKKHWRLGIDQALLRYRGNKNTLILGKQTFAWGVLDGLRITDRLDPVRHRDFIFTETRPQRLARWGAKWRTKHLGTALELALILDRTSSQLPIQGGDFYPTAVRSRGGVSSTNTLSAEIITPEKRASSATTAIKLARTIAGTDAQFVLLHGPDTEPVLAVGVQGNPELAYHNRLLVGLNLQKQLGKFVLRFEGAHIPKQRVNLKPSLAPQTTDVGRWLAGVGMDTRLGGWFINAQFGIDHLEAPTRGGRLVRPRTDLVTTLRAQRRFAQDRLELKAEVIGVTSTGDGVIRPTARWQLTDQVGMTLGADFMFGSREGLIGQFREQRRIWLRLQLVL